MDLRQKLMQAFRFRLMRCFKFPKGNVTSCLLNLAERGFEPHHIFDVGANKASWSRCARRVYPRCGITLIEPQIEMKMHLDAFCSRNEGCRWVLAGAGAEPGELPLTVHPDTVSSTFVFSQERADAAGLQRRMVPIVTLDSLVEENGGIVPDIVKIDAEGFESQILQGAKRLLGRTELFFLEVHLFGDRPNPSGFVEMTATMDDLGYVPYDFTWFGKRPHDGAIGLCEVAFARKSGTLRSYLGWNKPAAA
jgi:FkbM family methyltransferase